jgi:hypothetical protein
MKSLLNKLIQRLRKSKQVQTLPNNSIFLGFWKKLHEQKKRKRRSSAEVKSKKPKQYITEVVTWGVNQAKWKAATEYCADRNWEFKLITENELGIK